MPVRKQCPAKCGILCTFSLFSPFRAPPRIRRPHPAFRHRTLFAVSLCSLPLRAPPHSFQAPPCLSPLRFIPRSSALSRAAAPMSGRLRRLPCRRVPPRFVQPLHILSKEQNPCARGAGVSSHCHVMFRRRLTPRRGRCKPAHRRRASWLQARSHPSTHSG